MMSGENALRIAIVGLGTVGGGVIRLLETNRDLITRRAGRPITITAISARDRTKDRGVDLSPYAWVDDMSELAGREEIDAIVELIGGADGPALTLARQCLIGRATSELQSLMRTSYAVFCLQKKKQDTNK